MKATYLCEQHVNVVVDVSEAGGVSPKQDGNDNGQVSRRKTPEK